MKRDWLFFFLAVVLTIFGVIMVGNASVVEAQRDFGNKYYYLQQQFKWVLIGLGIFLIVGKIKYQQWRLLSVPLMILTFICLILVLIPTFSTEVLGAKRWLDLKIFTFQPAELAKFAFVLWLAAFLNKKQKAVPFLVVLGLLVGLVMLEPDLGTTVVIGLTGLIVYFISGGPLLIIGLIGMVGAVIGSLLITGSSYRNERLLTFLDPSKDPLGASYHIRQIILALGSGGLLGVGLGQSRQKYEYLPMVTTDSIFAVIAEELGFVGAVLLIVTFLFFILRGIKIAKDAPDNFGRLLGTGIIAWIGVQAMINLAAMVALVPLTGIPLPFISYGGSSLVLNLLGAGILVNISKK